MKKLWLILVWLALAGPASAQTNCGNGVPCGPLPWSIAPLPDLSSPTPMPTLVATSSSINPGDPTATLAPINTPTPVSVDVGAISTQMSAISTMLAATPMYLTTPGTLGLTTPNLVANPNFTSWSGDNPTGWTVVNEVAPDRVVTVHNLGARFKNNGNANAPQIRQTVLIVGHNYRVTITIGLRVSGTLAMGISPNTGLYQASSEGTFTTTFTNAPTGIFVIGTLPSQTADFVLSSVEVIDLTPNTALSQMGTNAGTFFGYVRGLSGESFGPLAPLVTLSVTAMILIISTKILTFILPVLAALFGLIRKIVSAILEFLPL